MAQLATPDTGKPGRESRGGRFLDLHLHQLAAHAPPPFARGHKSTAEALVSSASTHRSSGSNGTSTTSVERCGRCGFNTPLVIDNDYAIWRAFNNQYWPARYFIDARGRVRERQFGEGEYQRSEAGHQRLLAEAGVAGVARRKRRVSRWREASKLAADWDNLKSPETYVGYDRMQNFASRGGADSGLASRLRGARRVCHSISGP